MERTLSSTPKSQKAYEIITQLQELFVTQLNEISKEAYEPVEWFRDQGLHGGGVRYESRDEAVFNRASVNISQIHYDDVAEKSLSSATAISTIIHPQNPNASSMHLHISWTELKNGKGYWRIMADLNPAIENPTDTKTFTKALKEMAPAYQEEGIAQGEKYFYIPALERHRGVSHFYLENFNTNDEKADEDLAKKCGETVINTYIKILKETLNTHISYTKEEKEKQLAYHTLYLFQVLTLDRGTTSGLLVHHQNDVGILGSLPSHVDKNLLMKWVDKMPKPQNKLLKNIIKALPDNGNEIDATIKEALAQAVRKHYQENPKALSLQASGNSIPPTVSNHK